MTMNNHNELHDISWQALPSLDKHCFGCGTENHNGLRMTFARSGDRLRTQLTIPPQFRGWSSLVHGGVIATILDEVMSWTAIVVSRRFILTKNITVNYHRPVYVGAKVTAIGSISERYQERRATVAAELFDEEMRRCASAQGEFALFTKEQFERLAIIPEEDLQMMAQGW
jgi:uncharacterized protein (TIGR00369 family)